MRVGATRPADTSLFLEAAADPAEAISKRAPTWGICDAGLAKSGSLERFR